MDLKRSGSLTLKFNEARFSQQPVHETSTQYFLKISFGGNYFTTSLANLNRGSIKWEDTMKFVKTSEETMTIECFYINSHKTELKLASALFPLQTIVSKGSYKGLLLLMNLGRICMRVNVEILFEEKNDTRLEHLTIIYPLPPPELPHVHAYAIPPNFTYTPPAYYQALNGTDLEMN